MNDFRLWRLVISCVLAINLFMAPVRAVQVVEATGFNSGEQSQAGSTILDSDLAPTVISTIPDNGEIALATTNIQITFSEVVAVTDGWFSIACFSGAVTASATAGPASVFTLNPDRTLGSSDFCTVTIHHANVSDVDGIAPDLMQADYSWSFLTDIIDFGPEVVSTVPANQATEVAIDANLLITFDREVTLGSYTLTCDGTPVPSTPSGPNLVNYTIDPTGSLPGGAVCTLNIPANQVTEIASPFQNMLADLNLTFTVTTCGTPYTKINAIQQAGAASPLVGQDVTVEGIVTADFQASGKLNGFFMQSLAGDDDSNPATSEGLFVFTGTGAPLIEVNAGEHVRFSAKVAELGDTSAGQMAAMTGLNNVVASSLKTCATGVSLPAAVQINLPASSDPGLLLEAYEGMRVQFMSTMTVQQSSFLGRFGQLSLGVNSRIYHPNNGTSGSTDDVRRMVVLDDGSFSEYPFPVPYYGLNGAVRAGDTVENVVGVLDQGRISASISSLVTGFPDIFYRLHPTSSPLFTQSNLRSSLPDVGGAIKVASFNLNDYFVTIDDISLYGGSWPVGSGYDISHTPRGADSQAEFNRQQAKLVKAMAAIHADVFGLAELEAWNGADAASALAQALNTELAAPNRYAAVADPATGTGSDLTQVAIIYDTTTLSLVGSALSSANAIFEHAPVAQRFKSGNESFWVVVNQFKTRGDCPPSGADADQGDGQGCWNDTRKQQATALADFIAASLNLIDPDVLVIGDLNAYAAELPMQTLLDRGLLNQVEATVAESERYSFVSDSAAGYPDHALSTASVTRQLAGVSFWNINADEPLVIDYNTENKRFNGATSGSPDLYQADPYASSDHDPLVLGLTLFANQAPVVNLGIANQQATQDSTFDFQIPVDAFSDPNTGQMPGRADNLSYSAVLANGSPLPGWLGFTAATGAFSGIPASGDVGTISVRVTATDTSGASVSDIFDIVVDSSNHPPQVNASVAGQVAYSGLPFSLTLASNTFTDIDAGDVLTYSATLADDTALPGWLNFDPVTRTFSGVPGAVNFGQITIKVTVTDQASATASLTFVLQVKGKLFLPVVLRSS